MEIVLEIKRVEELPRVLIKHEPSDESGSLQLGALGTSFQKRHVFEPSQCSTQLSLLLNVLVNWDARKSIIEIIWLKHRSGITKVLWVIHAVIFLVLVSV